MHIPVSEEGETINHQLRVQMNLDESQIRQYMNIIKKHQIIHTMYLVAYDTDVQLPSLC